MRDRGRRPGEIREVLGTARQRIALSAVERAVMRILCIALAICSATSFRMPAISSRTTSLRMGLSNGDKFPAAALEKFGVAASALFSWPSDRPLLKQIAACDDIYTFADAGVGRCVR